jgi:hypothetical protein
MNADGAVHKRFDPAEVLSTAKDNRKAKSWDVGGPKLVFTSKHPGLRLHCPVGTPLLLLKETEAQLKNSKLIYGIGDVVRGKVRVWNIYGEPQPHLEAVIQFGLDNAGKKPVYDKDPALECFLILGKSNTPAPIPGYSVQVQAVRSRMFGILPYFPNGQLAFETIDLSRQPSHKSLDIPVTITGAIVTSRGGEKSTYKIADHEVEIKEVRAYQPTDSAVRPTDPRADTSPTLRATLVLKTSVEEAELVLNSHLTMLVHSAVESSVVSPEGVLERKTLVSPHSGVSVGGTPKRQRAGFEPVVFIPVGAAADGSETYIATNLNVTEASLNLPSGYVYTTGLIRGIPLRPKVD